MYIRYGRRWFLLFCSVAGCIAYDGSRACLLRSVVHLPALTKCCFVSLITAGTGTIQRRQIWGRKAPDFGWAILGWASCIIVQLGSSLDSCPTLPSPNPHFNRPSGHWPCVKSCLVGGSDKYSLITAFIFLLHEVLFIILPMHHYWCKRSLF